MNARVELVFDRECPHADAARERLRQVLEAVGASAEWHEWDREDPACPEYARRFGSPTILVNGQDVGGAGAQSDANACRVYRGEDGRLTGVPPSALIAAALTGSDMP